MTFSQVVGQEQKGMQGWWKVTCLTWKVSHTLLPALSVHVLLFVGGGGRKGAAKYTCSDWGSKGENSLSYSISSFGFLLAHPLSLLRICKGNAQERRQSGAYSKTAIKSNKQLT